MRTAQAADATAGSTPPGSPLPARRVRDQARDAVTLMVFSAVTSGGLAVALLLVTRLGR